MITSLPLANVRAIEELWPRSGPRDERVELFVDLYREGGPHALPPIEVVPDGQGAYLLADGWHRAYAASSLGWDALPAEILEQAAAMDPEGFAYERALLTATRSALPLTAAERRAAGKRLLKTRPDLTHAWIAKLVGVSRST